MPFPVNKKLMLTSSVTGGLLVSTTTVLVNSPEILHAQVNGTYHTFTSGNGYPLGNEGSEGADNEGCSTAADATLNAKWDRGVSSGSQKVAK
jgi:hypothetical protein